LFFVFLRGLNRAFAKAQIGRTCLKPDLDEALKNIKSTFALARKTKPAYEELYPFLETLFLLQATVKNSLELTSLEFSFDLVETKWDGGFSLLHRWDFPIDFQGADAVFSQIEDHIPSSNDELRKAWSALNQAFECLPTQKAELWQSFMQHDWEPWDEWVRTEGINMASLLFLARSCIRPSLEWSAEDLVRRFPIPESWSKGYCPICGSLPSLLFLSGDGERKAYCSWCGTVWGLHRLQCPYCENRYHESLGYLFVEAEPHYRAHYCRLCKHYFKQIDTRELLNFPNLPLEEWTTLHLDLLAQRAGWKQPPSPSPAVYGDMNVS
jgi:FdhE protein